MESTLNQQAYETIRRRLFRGEIPPGTRLVNRTLAEDIGMSFTPVREAINRLASDGLVEYTHGAGAFVRKLSRQELAQLYDVRALFEPFAATEAAHHITPNELAEMESLMARWEELATSIAARLKPPTPTQMHAWLDFDERFHERIVSACRNPWVAKLMGISAWSPSASPPRETPRASSPRRSSPTPASPTEGSLMPSWADDAETASDLVRAQLETGRKAVLNFFDSNQ